MFDEFKLLQEAMTKIQHIFQMEGARLELTNFQDNIVEVSLIISPSACRECIVDSEMLKQIIKDVLIEEIPYIKHVVLNDPRDNI